VTNITAAKYKASRRLGVTIWEDNDGKDPFRKRNYRPGQHGQNTMRKPSDYGLHLIAKQRLKCHYGRINEKQFKNIFRLALKMKGNTGENLIGLLERRVDAVVYRLNLAPSIFTARQLISHGHIKINGKKVDIPSQKLDEGDVIELSDKAKQMLIIVESANKLTRTVPDYLSLDPSKLSGKFLRIPTIADVPYPFQPEVHFVVEYYSH